MDNAKHTLKPQHGVRVRNFLIVVVLCVIGFAIIQYVHKSSSGTAFPQATITSQKPIYKATEQVIMRIKLNKTVGSTPNLIRTAWAQEEIISEPVFITPDGTKTKEIESTVEKISDDEYTVTVSPPNAFSPGKYTMEVTLHEGASTRQISQDFTWGVLAVNTDKSVYQPGETAILSLAVLDEMGNMVCDSNVELKIRNPQNEISTLTTKDGTIKVNEVCEIKEFTLIPDFEATYRVGNAGAYEMTLTAQTHNGSYTIVDTFAVRDVVPFDVKREGPTRIYPPVQYPMTFTITAQEDFTGTITEAIPSGFAVTGGEKGKSHDRIEKNASSITLSWDVSLKKGQSQTLSYQFKTPPESPYFYLLGPLEFVAEDGSVAFREERYWHLAIDAEVVIDDTASTSFAKHFLAGSKTVFINDTDGYVFYSDSDDSCVYRKTTDGGTNWGSTVQVDSQTDCIKVTVWYDRWTPGDTTGDLIHIITADTSADDLFYRTLDTGNSDTLSSGPTAISSAPGPAKTNSFDENVTLPVITKATDGKLYVGVHDNTAGDNSFIISCSSTCTTASNWSDVGTLPLDTGSTSANDMLLLMPLAGGNILAIRHDDSSDAVQSKVWNGSAWDGSWTDIDTTVPNHNSYDSTIRATVDPTTNDIYLAIMHDVNDLSTTDHDIQTAIYSGGSWTAMTDAMTNSNDGTDDAFILTGLAIGLDSGTGDVYIAYAGGEVVDDIYYKVSTDGMQSWSSRTKLNVTGNFSMGLNLNLVSNERMYATWYMQDPDDIFGNTVADLTPPVTGPTKIVFTNPQRSLTIDTCNGSAKVFTIQLQNDEDAATNPTASTVVRITSDSTGETIYTDDTCSTTATNGDFTFSTSENTKSFYIIDTELSSPSWTLSATRQSGDTLTTGTQTYSVVDAPAIDVRGGVEFRGGVSSN